MNNLIRLLLYELTIRKKCVAATIYTVLFKIFDIFPEIFLGLMLDIAIRKENSLLFQLHFIANIWNILLCGVIALAIFLLGTFFQYLSTKYWKKSASMVQLYLRMKLCDSILAKKSLNTLLKNEPLRDQERKLNRSIEIIEYFISNTLEDCLKLILSALIIGPILFVIAPVFLAYALVSLIPVFLIALLFYNKIQLNLKLIRNKTLLLYREFDELINGISVIKDYAIEKRFYHKIKNRSVDLLDASEKANHLHSLIVPASRVFIHIGIIAILVHGAVLLIQGQLSIGVFTAASFLSRKFLLPFSFFTATFEKVLKGIDCLNEISQHAILQKQKFNKEPEKVHAMPLQEINVINTDYSYGKRKVLNAINAKFKKEQINVIKGATGAGKTTLLRLLMQDFYPEVGNIYYGGSLAAQNAVKNLRHRIAFVPQIPILFNASIKDNITLFSDKINDSLLNKALSLSLTAEFINQLPAGIETMIGTNGIQLSGGQMQSIALARAFYSEATVLLLDEPTSAFDSERELLFLSNLRNNLQNKLVIMTSHRAQSIQAADYLVTI